jgi:hypothetical protein
MLDDVDNQRHDSLDDLGRTSSDRRPNPPQGNVYIALLEGIQQGGGGGGGDGGGAGGGSGKVRSELGPGIGLSKGGREEEREGGRV